MTTPPATPTTPSRRAPELTEALEASRAELLAALDAVPEDRLTVVPAGEHESVADVVWRTGDVEDWWRRWVRASLAGRAVEGHMARRRLEHMQTADLLHEWLHQSRRPLIAILERLDAGELERSFALPDGGETTIGAALGRLETCDRDAAAEVRRLAALLDGGAGR